jgi:hypothetical protein
MENSFRAGSAKIQVHQLVGNNMTLTLDTNATVSLLEGGDRVKKPDSLMLKKTSQIS